MLRGHKPKGLGSTAMDDLSGIKKKTIYLDYVPCSLYLHMTVPRPTYQFTWAEVLYWNRQQCCSIHRVYGICFLLKKKALCSLKPKICTYIHWTHIQTPPVFWGKWKEVHLSSSAHPSRFSKANLRRKRKEKIKGEQKCVIIAAFLQRKSKCHSVISITS